ncbi:hypothetical protein BgiMline_012517, partial [Biomphalaria glabrata]
LGLLGIPPPDHVDLYTSLISLQMSLIQQTAVASVWEAPLILMITAQLTCLLIDTRYPPLHLSSATSQRRCRSARDCTLNG